MTLTVGSLFSGIGGLELGLERAGMKTIWQCEVNPYARAVLAKNFPGVPCFEDIRQLDATHVIRPDVLCGGFPCQPHSRIGKRLASADPRDLWSEFARLIRDLGPRWVVAENVDGLLSSEEGAFFGRVLRDLAQFGFDAEWHKLSSCRVGAPHTRERVFLVAHPHGARRAQLHLAAVPTQALVADRGPDARWRARRAEPGVGRVAHGVRHRVDRIRALGNAVDPDVSEKVGRLIIAAHLASHAGQPA